MDSPDPRGHRGHIVRQIRVAPVTDVVRPLRTELAATSAGSATDRFGRLFCGTLADHWAVALPFEHVATLHPNTPPRVVRWLGRLVNHIHYPRAALFEALLRYVPEDLASPHPE